MSDSVSLYVYRFQFLNESNRNERYFKTSKVLGVSQANASLI